MGEHAVLTRGEHVLVAVSGGGDSTAMLLILARLASDFGWRLTAAHFDHRLRGREEASADLAFVAGLAEALGLPMVHGSGDVTRRVRTAGESVEQAARALRYRFLGTQAKEVGATVVAAGHTLDDQAETVMLHLIRGSGLDGLAGMRPRSGWAFGRGPEVARPLLTLRREETARYCRELGVSPREDATNESLLATRNRVRHEVMPALRKLNPNVEAALTRLADTAYKDVTELQAQAEGALLQIGRSRPDVLELDLAALRALRPAIRSRVLRMALARALRSDIDIEAPHVEALGRLADSRPGKVSLPRGVTVVRDSRTMSIRRGSPPVTAPIPETLLAVPGVTEVAGWRFEVTDSERRKSRSVMEVDLPSGVAAAGLRVRSRRPGDKMRPLGLGGTKKLQDILVDAKVARAERDGVPLLVTPDAVVWVVGLCVDERVAASGSGRVMRVRARRLRR